MINRFMRTVAAGLVLATTGHALAEQTGQQTVGLFVNDPGAYPGYTLFAPQLGTTTYLVDMAGERVHSWASAYQPGASVYLGGDGSLLRMAAATTGPGGAAGLVERFGWDGNLIWSYAYPLSHHDVAFTSDGHFFILAWEVKSFEESVQAGRAPTTMSENELWPEKILEVVPTGPTTGTIVWEWHLWDHLIQDFDATKDNFGVVADHPELVNINFYTTPIADWIHANALEYNPTLDQLMLTIPRFGEIWIIDHSTTTEEAAGHTGGNSGMGGDIIYRWGNPLTYGAGAVEDWKLFFPHNARWIPEGSPGGGNILVYNNGLGRPDGDYSSVEEIAPPVNGFNYSREPGTAFGPETPTWSYTSEPAEDFFSNFISGAQRLPNGNTLICEGKSGRFFEVAPDGTILWQYVNPVINTGIMIQEQALPPFPFAPDPGTTANFVFRSTRYGTKYPGFAGRDLTPQGLIERPACRTDLSCDGDTGFDDLTSLLAAWGPCVDCAADVDDDGQAGFSDLTALLNAWGPCE